MWFLTKLRQDGIKIKKEIFSGRRNNEVKSDSWYGLHITSRRSAIIFHALSAFSVPALFFGWCILLIPQYSLSILETTWWLIPITLLGGALDGHTIWNLEK
jgi:hypothetical protein